MKKSSEALYQYPLSCNSGKLNVRLFEILRLHCRKGAKILDPTCGEKMYIWGGTKQIDTKVGLPPLVKKERFSSEYELVFSDFKPTSHGITAKFQDLKYQNELDCIVFDPPYLFGTDESNDPRTRIDKYGGYGGGLEQLKSLIQDANTYLPKFLKSEGKLVLKCSDMFYLKKREFHPLHVLWVNLLTNFKLIDVFIYQYGRLNPTSFQVKNRPCSVINHTYFLVFVKREENGNGKVN